MTGAVGNDSAHVVDLFICVLGGILSMQKDRFTTIRQCEFGNVSAGPFLRSGETSDSVKRTLSGFSLKISTIFLPDS